MIQVRKDFQLDESAFLQLMEDIHWTSPGLLDRFKGTNGSNRGGVYVESEVHRGVQG